MKQRLETFSFSGWGQTSYKTWLAIMLHSLHRWA